MKRRRISQVGIAGILAVISAVGLIAVVSFSNGALKQINPTEEQQTVDAIVRTRLTQTAEMRATVTAEATEAAMSPIWLSVTAFVRMKASATADSNETIDPIWLTATEVRVLVGTIELDHLTPGVITPDAKVITEAVTPQS